MVKHNSTSFSWLLALMVQKTFQVSPVKKRECFAPSQAVQKPLEQPELQVDETHPASVAWRRGANHDRTFSKLQPMLQSERRTPQGLMSICFAALRRPSVFKLAPTQRRRTASLMRPLVTFSLLSILRRHAME